MATTVIYNGVVLHNVLTRRWEQTPLMDDSDTDRIGSRYRCRWEGILHNQLGQSVAWQTENGTQPFISTTLTPGDRTPAQLYQLARRQLEQPRGQLQVFFGGQLVLEATSATAAGATRTFADISNGPKPRLVSLEHISSVNTFRVAFEVDVDLTECGSDSTRPFVLNNRWGIEEIIDQNWFTTRAIRGRIRIASANIPAHAVKDLCLPGLEPGFHRQSVSMVVAPNGLEADYQIIDRQLANAAPWPATDWTFQHGEKSTDGMLFTSELTVELSGPPNADPRLMFARAMQFTENRIQFLARISGSELLTHWELLHLGGKDENRVRVNAAVSGPAGEDTIARIKTQGLAQPIEFPDLDGHDYKANVQGVPPTWGVDSGTEEAARSPVYLFLQTCYLQSACNPQHQIAQGNQNPAPDSGAQEPTEPSPPSVRVVGAPLPEDPPTTYSEKHMEAVYTFCRMSSEYITDRGKVAMPIAVSSTPAASTVNVFQLGNSVCHRRIVADFERLGEAPQLPAPLENYTDGNLIGTLKHHRIKIMAPTLDLAGRKKVHHLRAEYIYILNRPPSATETVNVGVMPFTSFTPLDNRLNLGNVYNANIGP